MEDVAVMKRSRSWLLVCAVVFGAIAFAQGTVKIGVLAPITGTSAADGQEMVQGARLAVNEINAGGGVDGYQLAIVVGDVKSQQSDAVVSAIDRITSDKEVQAMMTGYASPTNFEINIMAQMNMPYLISGNSAQTVKIIAPHPQNYPTVWSLTPSYDAYQSALVPLIDSLVKSGSLTLPNRKVALITSDNPYSKTIYEGLTKNFRDAGWDITMNAVVPFGTVNDWSNLLSQIRNEKPAVVINTDYLPGNAATFMNQFMDDPTDSLVFIQYAPSVPEFVKLTAANSTGVLYNLLGGYIPTSPLAQAIVKKFKAAYGADPGTYGVALYEEVQLYAQALKQVLDAGGKPSDHLAISKVIAATNEQTASGHLSFDPKTHLAVQGDSAIPITFFQIWDGNRILFSPKQYANGTFRMPPWMKK